MKKKMLGIVSSGMGAILLVVICLAAFIVLSSRLSGGEPTFRGYQVKAVLSGSMEPTFQTGSIISIKLGDEHTPYEKGDIITFRMEDKLITHRIIDVLKDNGQAVYKTKGDHNNGPDLWTVPSQTIIGKYTNFTIPYIGYALKFANSKAGSALLLIVPGILLMISAFRSIIVAKRELEGSKA
ncbi:signal peptidase I [Bacillus sp. AFS015802]|uniref:signal peptidase I SipW n=1 Tax=Bacillus sp. AFS015802 TaxID=2033486 RepID=UPI000BF907A7|nr:signal peptidase I [Bacillus sp. AFS015802]PFA66792.1 signal peptidase I [Bacillus sp. AFS015802]